MFFVYVYVFNEEFFSTYTRRAARAEKSRLQERKGKFLFSFLFFSTDRMNEYDTHKRRRRRRRRRRRE
jgi:hypothetical protein